MAHRNINTLVDRKFALQHLVQLARAQRRHAEARLLEQDLVRVEMEIAAL